MNRENLRIPNSLEVYFPCDHCKDCIRPDYILEPKYISFDGIEQYRITCKHAEVCPDWECKLNNEKSRRESVTLCSSDGPYMVLDKEEGVLK